MAGFGLKIVKSQGPEGFTGNLSNWAISPTNTGSIYNGDPVKLDSNGFIVEATGGASNDDFFILGIFQGCQYVDADGSYKFRQYWNGGAGRSQIQANVALPSGAVVAVRGTAGATYTQAAFGKRFGMVYAAGSTAYGDSRSSLGAATAATGPLMVLGLAALPGNSFASPEPTFICSIARSEAFPQLYN